MSVVWTPASAQEKSHRETRTSRRLRPRKLLNCSEDERLILALAFRSDRT